MSETALLTFSIGPVHSFIGQARRIADLWAGSRILSRLAGTAIGRLHELGGEPVFPAAKRGAVPRSLPNRIVAEVPLDRADDIAHDLDATVHEEWGRIVGFAIETLGEIGLRVSLPPADKGTWDDALSCSWSWVAENGDYVEASQRGAELFAASRVYRPFRQIAETGTKCAICGERNALPDGTRSNVIAAWTKAETAAKQTKLEPFFRERQTRLCLVCAAKRLHPYSEERETTRFRSFQDFQPEEGAPYFALVAMDGDRLGEALRGDGAADAAELRALQWRISAALGHFADALRHESSSRLNLEDATRRASPPQLIYAGGEDVLFVCDPRDAIDLASAVRERYRAAFVSSDLDPARYTLSGAVVFAHTKTPAGLLLREADDLLKRKAKEESGRDSIAIALRKRSAPPVETVFRWDDPLRTSLTNVVGQLWENQLASGQTYSFAEEDRLLSTVLHDAGEWTAWLKGRLSRGAKSKESAADLAALLTPYFTGKKVDALRIARFLAVEVEDRESAQASEATA